MEVECLNLKSESWMMKESLTDMSSCPDDWLTSQLVSMNWINQIGDERDNSTDQFLDIRQANRTMIIFGKPELSQSGRTNRSASSQSECDLPEPQWHRKAADKHEPGKRALKRSQTTLPQKPGLLEVHKDAFLMKRSKNKIEKDYEKFLQHKSNFTRLIKTQELMKKRVYVKYFDGQCQLAIKIPDSIIAIEFINIALKEFRKEPKFDQKLLLYPNYTLAYQLKGLEEDFDGGDDASRFTRRPIQKSKSEEEGEELEMQAMENERCQSEHSGEQLIQIGMESKIQFRVVHLVSHEDGRFGLNLKFVQMQHEQNPELIIIIVENPITANINTINIHPQHTVGDLFDRLIMKTSDAFSKNDHYLCLKYPCSRFGQDPLSHQLPISQLPIHWLIILSKYCPFNTPEINLNTSFESEPMHKDTYVSASGMKSHRILFDDTLAIDKTKKLQSFYGYQEFTLSKWEPNYQSELTVAIDYFDLYYTYKVDQQKPFSLYRLAKDWVSQLFTKLENKPIKRYRRIPIRSILSVTKTENGKGFEVTYEKEQGYHKRLTFTAAPNVKKSMELENFKVMIEAYSKLEYLVEMRKRQKNNNF